MKILKTISDNLVQQKENKHVKINKDIIDKYILVESLDYFNPPPYLDSLPDNKHKYEVIHIFNLIQASLQYCFFFGTSSKRIDNIDSQWILKELDNVFKELKIKQANYINEHLIYKFIDILISSNITLLDTRIQALKELLEYIDFGYYGRYYNNIPKSIELMQKLPTFKKDIFFKKGLFAIMMTHRFLPDLQENDFQLHSDLIKLPVPADYQIPKMLRHLGFITYSDELSTLIEDDKIIPENSKIELDIRSATIQVVDLLARQNGTSTNAVDAYLFAKRKSCQDKHHLTITTNY